MASIHRLGLPKRRSKGLRPTVDLLERRALPTKMVVTGTGDTIAADGVFTLREAITAANTNAPSGDTPAGSAGLDEIDLNFQAERDASATTSHRRMTAALSCNQSTRVSRTALIGRLRNSISRPTWWPIATKANGEVISSDSY